MSGVRSIDGNEHDPFCGGGGAWIGAPCVPQSYRTGVTMQREGFLGVVFGAFFWLVVPCGCFPIARGWRMVPHCQSMPTPMVCGGWSKAMERSPAGRSTSLMARNNDNDNIDAGIVASDLVSLVLAFEFMGLLDVLNDPAFVSNGGWLQAIPAAPATLPTLVQRLSINSAIYLTVCTILGAFSTKKLASTMDQIRISGLQNGVAFGAARILLAALLANSGTVNGMDWSQLLRECYFVVLATTSSRYLLYRLNADL